MKYSEEDVGQTGTIKKFTLTRPSSIPIFLITTIPILIGLGTIMRQPIFILPIFWIFYQWYSQTVEESLFVIKNLGLQITKTQRSGHKKDLFIDHADINHIIINEGLTPYSVVSYLAIILFDASELIVPFQEFQVSIDQIKHIYNQINPLLHE